MSQNKSSSVSENDNSQTTENHYEPCTKLNDLRTESNDNSSDLSSSCINKKQVDLLLAAARQRGLRA